MDDASALVDVVALSETASETSTDDVRPMPESSEESPATPAEHEEEAQDAEEPVTEDVGDDAAAADDEDDEVEAVERDADRCWREVDWCVIATTEPDDMDEPAIAHFFAWLTDELTAAFADRPPPVPLNERPRRPGDASSVVFRHHEAGGTEAPEQLVYWAPSGDADALRARYETLQRERPGVMVVFHLLPEANTNDYDLMKTLSLEFGFVRQGILVQNARNRFASIEKPVGEIVANIGDWITKRLFELAFGSRKQRGATFDVTFAGDTAAAGRTVSSLRPFTGCELPPRHRQPNPAQRAELVAAALHPVTDQAVADDSDAPGTVSSEAEEALRCVDLSPVPRHITLYDIVSLFHARRAAVTSVRFGRLDASTGAFVVPYAAVGAFDPSNPECLAEVGPDETPAARVRFQSKFEAVSVYEQLMGERVAVGGATAGVSLSCRRQCAAYFDDAGRSLRPFVYVDRRLSPPKNAAAAGGKPPQANRSAYKRSALAPRQ